MLWKYNECNSNIEKCADLSCTKRKLDPDQQEAYYAILDAFNRGCNVVIKAGAGSGKTETLLQTLIALIKANEPDSAMVISHTKVTTDTFMRRLHNTDVLCSIKTIHALALSEIDEKNGAYVEDTVDYDSMLDKFIEHLELGKSLSAKLNKVGMIFTDEIQDTGDKQMKVLHLLRRRLGCALVVVGDGAQAIYGFQGGSAMHMIELSAQQNTVLVELRYNYRSNSQIVLHANRLGTSYNRINGVVEMIPVRKRNPDSKSSYPLQLRCFDEEKYLKQAVIAWINYKHCIGILQTGDTLTFRVVKNMYYFEDYAGRVFNCNATTDISHLGLHDGDTLQLNDIKGEHDENIDLNIHATPPVALTIKNRRPRIAVLCFERNGKRAEPFVEIQCKLIADANEAAFDMFATSEENKELSNFERKQAMQANLCFLTVHGAKGGEWDTVLHIDLGTRTKNPSHDLDPDELENHNKLYTSHTRAIDDVWHFVLQSPFKSGNSNAMMSRYMTEEIIAQFNKEPEPWEQTLKFSNPRPFKMPEVSPRDDDQKNQHISVTELAKDTKTAHKFNVFYSTEHVQLNKTSHPKLPQHLRYFNAIHGLMLEMLLLWDLHKEHTRNDLTRFLQIVNSCYHVNYEFASTMINAWKNTSENTKRKLFKMFHKIRKHTDDSNSRIKQTYETLIKEFWELLPETNKKKVAIEKIRQGFHNIRYRQQHIEPLTKRVDVCPVRTNIKHFDNGGEDVMWHLSNIGNGNLKDVLSEACKCVQKHLGNASLKEQFLTMLFMQCLDLNHATGEIKTNYETKWKTLLDVLITFPEHLTEYLRFLECMKKDLRADAKALQHLTNVKYYQEPVEENVEIQFEGSCYYYTIVGNADAVGDNSVLEVTSREDNAHQKIQQNCIYSSMVPCEILYNYYVESRRLVIRRRCIRHNTFLKTTIVEYILKRGLPNQYEKRYKSDIDRMEITIVGKRNKRLRE